MIIGIGNDLIEIDRVVKACEREAFLCKYFTEKERDLIAADVKKAADKVKAAASCIGDAVAGWWNRLGFA